MEEAWRRQKCKFQRGVMCVFSPSETLPLSLSPSAVVLVPSVGGAALLPAK